MLLARTVRAGEGAGYGVALMASGRGYPASPFTSLHPIPNALASLHQYGAPTRSSARTVVRATGKVTGWSEDEV